MKVVKTAKEYTIIDDIIPVEEQERIERLISNAQFTNQIPWYYSPSSYHGTVTDAFKQDVKKMKSGNAVLEDAIDTSQLVHNLWSSPKPGAPAIPGSSRPPEPVISEFYHFFLPVFTSIPVGYKKIIRAKINMKHQVANVPDSYYGLPHCDVQNPAPEDKICIYYINDSDGDTVIFDKRYKEWYASEFQAKLKVIATVPPKRGRMVIFDGDLVHSAGLPKKSSMRYIININLAGCFPKADI